MSFGALFICIIKGIISIFNLLPLHLITADLERGKIKLLLPPSKRKRQITCELDSVTWLHIIYLCVSYLPYAICFADRSPLSQVRGKRTPRKNLKYGQKGPSKSSFSRGRLLLGKPLATSKYKEKNLSSGKALVSFFCFQFLDILFLVIIQLTVLVICCISFGMMLGMFCYGKVNKWKGRERGRGRDEGNWIYHEVRSIKEWQTIRVMEFWMERWVTFDDLKCSSAISFFKERMKTSFCRIWKFPQT